MYKYRKEAIVDRLHALSTDLQVAMQRGIGEYTRRDTSHVDPSMRPTKYDYDRYLKLVQLGASVNWDQRELKKIHL